MAGTTSKSTISTVNKKSDTKKDWLHRCMRKESSRKLLISECARELCRHSSTERPQTAPSDNSPTNELSVPTSLPFEVLQGECTQPTSPPGRPLRPSSGIIRDVNAWLDTSTTTAPPLMGGLSYWRKTTASVAKDTAGIQHAIPIVQESGVFRPSTSHSQPGKLLRQRPKNMPMQKPSVVHKRSYRNIIAKKVRRRSHSMPTLGIAYETTHQVNSPTLMTRTRLLLLPNSKDLPSKVVFDHGGIQTQDDDLLRPRLRYGSSNATNKTEGNMGQCANELLRQSARSAGSTRPSTTASPLTRVDSVDSLSNAPTYSSGLRPPSYGSKAGSIMSTSSFGCIDGMNPEYRQLSQQRAAEQRGAKGKWRRFAQNFTAG